MFVNKMHKAIARWAFGIALDNVKSHGISQSTPFNMFTDGGDTWYFTPYVGYCIPTEIATVKTKEVQGGFGERVREWTDFPDPEVLIDTGMKKEIKKRPKKEAHIFRRPNGEEVWLLEEHLKPLSSESVMWIVPKKKDGNAIGVVNGRPVCIASQIKQQK